MNEIKEVDFLKNHKVILSETGENISATYVNQKKKKPGSIALAFCVSAKETQCWSWVRWDFLAEANLELGFCSSAFPAGSLSSSKCPCKGIKRLTWVLSGRASFMGVREVWLHWVPG